MNQARVLVAEDNPVNRTVALRALQDLGYVADAVSNGREAVEALDSARYDLVLMDCRMPTMDGYEAAREIRCREGSAHRIPIIAMTADTFENDTKRCRAAGMDDYLAKPFRLTELAQVLERWTRPSLLSSETVTSQSSK
jgi:CheY-like chemotaxis protein